MEARALADPAIAARIRSARGFIFDMDGTLALGDKASGGHVALPGAIALLAELRKRGVPFRVFTNGSAKPPPLLAASLRRAGFDVADAEMMTPTTSRAWRGPIPMSAQARRNASREGLPSTLARLPVSAVSITLIA